MLCPNWQNEANKSAFSEALDFLKSLRQWSLLLKTMVIKMVINRTSAVDGSRSVYVLANVSNKDITCM